MLPSEKALEALADAFDRWRDATPFARRFFVGSKELSELVAPLVEAAKEERFCAAIKKLKEEAAEAHEMERVQSEAALRKYYSNLASGIEYAIVVLQRYMSP
jgi:hypothetical protein